MSIIVEENLVSFKELEQKIFDYVCKLGRKITKIMLKFYDRKLAEGHDKKNYRCKGKRKTTIKQVLADFPKFVITYSLAENKEGSQVNQQRMR